ncbi:MAG: zinc ribbon domain-containing protein, partial [Oscillospiraceae bacterium]
MKCSQCGSENNAGINYCTSCGNDLNAQANGEAVLVDNNPQATETVFAKMPEKFIQGESVFQTLEETQRQQMQQVPIGANIDPDVANVNPITFGRPKKSIMPKILVLLGVLFIAGGLLVAIFFKDIQKAVVGQAKFYVMQESKSIKTGTEGAQKNFVSLMNQSMNVSGTAKLIGPEELMSQFLN